MKILFTADVHIKLGQKGVPVEWALNRYTLLKQELNRVLVEQKCDEIMFGGDTFDRVPTMQEIGVFFDLMTGLSPAVKKVIYSGNHEAVRKDTTFLTHFRPVLRDIKVELIDDYYISDDYEVLPYNRLKDFSKRPTTPSRPILFTHVRGAIPPHVIPEVPLELFEGWDIVVAGDLHSKENSQGNIYYPGSPVTTSFHRSVTDTYVIVLDTDKGEMDWHKLNVPCLIRKTVTSADDMVATDWHHTVYELEGDMQEIATIGKVDTPLLDKKIVKRDKGSSLDLSKAKTITDEVHAYLVQKLGLDDSKAKQLIGKLHDHIPNIELE